MCWKRKSPVTEITSLRVFLGFGINDYQGAQNDLQGCVPDINNEEKKLNKQYPNYQVLKYFDSVVTTQFFMSETRRVMSELSELARQRGERGFLYLKYSGHGTQVPGNEPNGYHEALYLHNGPLIDDNIYQLEQETPDNIDVSAKFDSCFSGNIGEKSLILQYHKVRFMPMMGVPILTQPVNRLAITDIGQRWIIGSGCGEEQTSADAYIDGGYQGAYTWADLQSYSPGIYYLTELINVKTVLHANQFEQIPEISGPYDGRFMPV